ncbi:putative aminopeptidase [Sesbania bispinosa]|nr:putative aminopeptidase [Sesbania bispinosa]
MNAKLCLANSPPERATGNRLRLAESPLENAIIRAAWENHHRKSPSPRREITVVCRAPPLPRRQITVATRSQDGNALPREGITVEGNETRDTQKRESEDGRCQSVGEGTMGKRKEEESMVRVEERKT